MLSSNEEAETLKITEHNRSAPFINNTYTTNQEREFKIAHILNPLNIIKEIISPPLNIVSPNNL